MAGRDGSPGGEQASSAFREEESVLGTALTVAETLQTEMSQFTDGLRHGTLKLSVEKLQVQLAT